MSDTAVAIQRDQGLAPASEGAAFISMIERAARDPNVNIEKLERLLAMKERVESRDNARAFNAAISAAKGEIGTVARNKTVDFTSQKGRTHYRHEDFAEIARTVDFVLKRHGLSYRFRSSQAGSKLTITCVLFHAGGHSEETTLEVAEDHSGNKNAIQAIGSAATYLQRYTLKLALGLASSADDDGRKVDPSNAVITGDQAEELAKLISETRTDIALFLELGGVESLSDIPAAQFAKAKALLLAKKKGSKS